MTIAVGYIPTPAGKRALEEAIDRAAQTSRKLTIINVERGDRPGDLRHASDEQLAEALESARSTKVEATIVTVSATDGDDFVDCFLTAVRDVEPELLVIGSRRDSSVPPHMAGLTMQHIVADAPCSVLVV